MTPIIIYTITLVLITLLCVYCYKEYKKTFFIFAGIIGPFLLLNVANIYIESSKENNSRNEFKTKLSSLNSESILMIINGDTITDKKSILINELFKVETHSAHHSFPNEEFGIVIKHNNGNELKFSIYRDSEYRKEYWIKYGQKYIGSIESGYFTRFQKNKP